MIIYVNLSKGAQGGGVLLTITNTTDNGLDRALIELP